jgi:hypothetical protein
MDSQAAPWSPYGPPHVHDALAAVGGQDMGSQNAPVFVGDRG